MTISLHHLFEDESKIIVIPPILVGDERIAEELGVGQWEGKKEEPAQGGLG